MALYDALELTMIDEKRVEYVRGSEGVPIERELERFIRRSVGYESGWVKVEGGDDGRYVRYDRIASVSIRRGLDDHAPPIVAFR
jgi:hypothetical protein